jgi:hypothetical protein
MRSRTMLFVAAILLIAPGCYRATVDTGLVPSGQVVRNDWASSFIGGLVPPATVETASRCPNGVATVQTQLSFLNMLVSGFTFGLYTPMTILVQCAAARTGSVDDSSLRVAATASLDQRSAVMNEAVRLARESGVAVEIQFE